MSLLVAGNHLETKPNHPRDGVIKGKSPQAGNWRLSLRLSEGTLEHIAQFKPYSVTLAFTGSLVVDRQPKPQTIFTAMQNLRGWLLTARIPADAVDGTAVIVGINPVVGKSSIEYKTFIGTLPVEADLYTNAVNMAFYIQPLGTSPKADYSSQLMYGTITRMMELAREKDYFWHKELSTVTDPVGGEFTEGQAITVTAPTWGGAPNIAYWFKDGVALVPHQDGLADLVIPVATFDDVGNYQVKAGIRVRAGYTTAQWGTSKIAIVTVPPTTFIVTEQGENIAGENGELLITEDS